MSSQPQKSPEELHSSVHGYDVAPARLDPDGTAKGKTIPARPPRLAVTVRSLGPGMSART